MTISVPPPANMNTVPSMAGIVKASGTSFYWGMRVLPPQRRDAMYALYAFCRVVDDIADDDGLSPQQRVADLLIWRRRLDDLFDRNRSSDPITAALQAAMTAFGLVKADLIAIIDGMEMDALSVIRAPSLADLDLYCDRVASAVGRSSVRIFGDSSATAQQVAYHLGRALQLTNILRDLAEDAARGRLYLPREILTVRGIESDDPALVLADASLPLVCRDVADMAEKHFIAADAAMAACDQTAMKPARLMRAMYYPLLVKLRANDWARPLTRVRLSKIRKILILLRQLVF
jgi:presqualene diphosphate synthase